MFRWTQLRFPLAGLLLALLCAARSWPAAPEAEPVLAPFVTLSGSASHVLEPRCQRILTQEEWSAVWLEHLGEPAKPHYDLFYNKAGLPVVDFEQCMVVAVFLGASENCAGVSASAGPLEDPQAETMTPVVRGDAVLRLQWHGFQTAGPDGGAQAVTPFGFFVVARSAAPLVIQDLRMPMGGGRGRIVERARLPAPTDGGR